MRTSRLYDQLQTLLGQPMPWADKRHLQTLIGMVIGVIFAECISLPKWSIYSYTRAVFAQSHQRRFSRWLHNPRINVHKLYSPLIQKALADWDGSNITLPIRYFNVVEQVLFDSVVGAVSRTSSAIDVASDSTS